MGKLLHHGSRPQDRQQGILAYGPCGEVELGNDCASADAMNEKVLQLRGGADETVSEVGALRRQRERLSERHETEPTDDCSLRFSFVMKNVMPIMADVREEKLFADLRDQDWNAAFFDRNVET